MGGKRWTDDEDAQIAKLAERGLTLIDNMHLLPGRTYDAAKVEASRLGISLKDAAAWSPEDRHQLRAIYKGNESIKAAVHRLMPHRGYLAAKREAQRIGIAGTISRAGRTGYSWVFAAIEAALADDGRMTQAQLATATGASANAVNKAIAKNHGKKIRIADHTRASKFGNHEGLWELGAGPDVPPPAPKTSSAASRDWRARERIRSGHVDPFAGLVQQVTA